jgi:nucleotide-binding universal stress UspA family protein
VGQRAGHARRYQAWFRPHLGFILANLAFAAGFVALALSAFHAPAPHDLPVGIVASATTTGRVEQALAAAQPGGFDLRVYRTEAAARTGIADRDVDGAMIGTGGHLRLLVAGAGGTGPDQALARVFGAVAARSGQPLAVADVRPPAAADSSALSPFFVILGVLVPSLAAGSASALVFRRARPAWCVAAPVVVAVTIGLAAAGIADGLAGLGSYAALAGIVALFSLAVSAPTAVLGRIWPPLVALAVLVFLVLGLPVSGGPGSLASFGPGFLRPLDPALPMGVAASAVRNAAYFGGHDVAGHVWVLAAWAAAGIAALALLTGLRRPAAPHLAAGLHAAGPLSIALAPPAGARQPAESAPGLVLLPAGPAFLPAGPEPATRAERPDPVSVPPITMVLGFDDSEPARRALGWAARQLAGRPGILHVVYADHPQVDSDLSGFGHEEMAAARDREAAGVAAAAAGIAAGAGVQYTFERREDAPAEAILAAASSMAAAAPAGDPVIVVGRSGHAARHVLGSVPVRLLHHSPYPVLAVP